MRIGQAIDILTTDKDSIPLFYLSDFEFLRSIKKNMKLGLIIGMCLLFGGISAQSDTITHRGELKILLTVPYARNIEYWGSKGIAAEPLVSGLETRIQILESKVSFHELINRNCTKAQEEYRIMVQNAAGVNAKLEKELSGALNERDKWQLKAKNRGLIISLGTAALATFAYIQIAN